MPGSRRRPAGRGRRRSRNGRGRPGRRPGSAPAPLLAPLRRIPAGKSSPSVARLLPASASEPSGVPPTDTASWWLPSAAPWRSTRRRAGPAAGLTAGRSRLKVLAGRGAAGRDEVPEVDVAVRVERHQDQRPHVGLEGQAFAGGGRAAGGRRIAAAAARRWWRLGRAAANTRFPGRRGWRAARPRRPGRSPLQAVQATWLSPRRRSKAPAASRLLTSPVVRPKSPASWAAGSW